MGLLNLLTAYQKKHLVEFLPYHECDNQSRQAPDLECLIKLQAQHTQQRHLIFLTGIDFFFFSLQISDMDEKKNLLLKEHFYNYIIKYRVIIVNLGQVSGFKYFFSSLLHWFLVLCGLVCFQRGRLKCSFSTPEMES